METITMATRKPKPKDTEPDIQLLTTAKCPSISGRGEVRYSIGNLDGDIHIKLVGSSGGGQINNSWIPFADILKLLESHSGGDAFTSTIFKPIFANVSSNNAGSPWQWRSRKSWCCLRKVSGENSSTPHRPRSSRRSKSSQPPKHRSL
jgi:hypothetical protein